MNGGEVFLPIEKCLLFRTETINGNPEGRSMFRNSFTSYHYAKNLREIEAIGIERDMTGLPVLRVPPSIMAASTGTREAAIRSDLEKLGQQIRRDERAFMMLPAKVYAGQETGYDFELMASPGSHSIDTDTVIRRYESRMAMPLLAEVMFLGRRRFARSRRFAWRGKARDVREVHYGAFPSASLHRSTTSRFLDSCA